MSASENSDSSEHEVQQLPQVVAGVSMRDLLAAGVAAKAISTPPREPEVGQPVAGHREAA